MITTEKTILLAAALMSAGTISMLGCAQIIGADFDRVLVDGGGGGGSAIASAAQATSSAEASSSSTGTGGKTPELCDLGMVADGEDNLNIHVYAHEMPKDGGTAAHKFYSYREGFDDPTGDYGIEIGAYELFRQSDPTRVPVFQCLDADDYHVGTKAEVEDASCRCLGYAAKTNTGKKKLLKIVGDTVRRSAYVTDSGSCSQYGYHVNSGDGCATTDLTSASN